MWPQTTSSSSTRLQVVFTLHGTKKLRDRIKVPETTGAPPSDTLLGDWYGTALFWKPQAALLLNTETMIPVLMPLAPASTLLERMLAEVVRVLNAHGVPESILRAEQAAMSECSVAKTASRSLLGVMNQITADATWVEGHAERLLDLSIWLADRPIRLVGGRVLFPLDALAEITR